jgi:hypothetical protein
MASAIEELIDKQYDDVKKYIDRADYFLDNEEPQQALKDFVNAFEAYQMALQYTESLKKSYSSSPSVRYKDSEKITCLFMLGTLLHSMFRCCIRLEKNDEIKFAYTQFKNVVAELSKSEDILEVKRIQTLRNFREKVNLFKPAFAENEPVSEGFLSDDPEFARFQKVFNEICKLSICPLQVNYSTDSSCFIATAAYGVSNHSDLDTFRQFRNRWLLTNSVGRKSVNVYYQFGPRAALYVIAHPLLQGKIRKFLKVLAKLMRKFKITAS